MPRQARLILDNVCYHIMARGNRKQIVFRDERDFSVYLRFVLRYKDRYKFKLYGWCLMKNHVHMVIESGQLGKIMHGINMSYSQYFNYKYNVVGHLWQDRYKSYIVQKDLYLINCISYIESNPVRANLVSRHEDYKWCSYKARVLGGSDRLLDPFTL